MSDARKPDSRLDAILAQWRASIGPAAFDRALPGQTLRARISDRVAPPGSEEATHVQHSFPGRVTPAALAPRRDSLARWSEYTLQELVGEGGMGQIFRADQGSLRRDVALKKILPRHLEKESAQGTNESFVAEALVTGFLEHPNIVPVHALGQDADGAWFFSMKMVRGVAWKYMLHPDACADDAAREKARGFHLDIGDPVPRAAHLEDNLRILLSVCNALAFAHSKHIIHRDLKPENIMVGAFGEVLVMDWGLAVDVAENPDAGTTDSQGRVPHKSMAGLGGTAEYMAPEQLLAEGALSPRTDVFLLGAIVYELLTGRAPNAADNLNQALIRASLCEEPPGLEGAPPELAKICRKALSRDPRQRYENALTMQEALNAFLKHQAATAIASKAEKEAGAQTIPNLARAVVLYDQALELWPENAATQSAAARTRRELTIKEGRARTTARLLYAAVASIVIGLTAGFFWVRGANRDLQTQKEKTDRANATLKAQLHQASLSDFARARQLFHDEKPEDARPGEALAYLARALEFDPSNQLAQAESAGRILHRHDLGQPTLIATINGGAVTDAKFSPDGLRILTISTPDNSVHIWDAATRAPVGKAMTHARAIHNAEFSRDGNYVVTASANQTTQIWDARTGDAVGVPLRSEGVDNMVTGATFSPDGRFVLTVSLDHAARVWDVRTGKLIGALRHAVPRRSCQSVRAYFGRQFQSGRTLDRDRGIGQDRAYLGRGHSPANGRSAAASARRGDRRVRSGRAPNCHGFAG